MRIDRKCKTKVVTTVLCEMQLVRGGRFAQREWKIPDYDFMFIFVVPWILHLLIQSEMKKCLKTFLLLLLGYYHLDGEKHLRKSLEIEKYRVLVSSFELGQREEIEKEWGIFCLPIFVVKYDNWTLFLWRKRLVVNRKGNIIVSWDISFRILTKLIDHLLGMDLVALRMQGNMKFMK